MGKSSGGIRGNNKPKEKNKNYDVSVKDIFDQKYKIENGLNIEQTKQLNVIIQITRYFKQNSNEIIYKDGSTNGIGGYQVKYFRNELTNNLKNTLNQLYKKTNNLFIKDVIKSINKKGGYTEKQQDIIVNELIKYKDIQLKGMKLK